MLTSRCACIKLRPSKIIHTYCMSNRHRAGLITQVWYAGVDFTCGSTRSIDFNRKTNNFFIRRTARFWKKKMNEVYFYVTKKDVNVWITLMSYCHGDYYWIEIHVNTNMSLTNCTQVLFKCQMFYLRHHLLKTMNTVDKNEYFLVWKWIQRQINWIWANSILNCKIMVRLPQCGMLLIAYYWC